MKNINKNNENDDFFKQDHAWNWYQLGNFSLIKWMKLTIKIINKNNENDNFF